MDLDPSPASRKRRFSSSFTDNSEGDDVNDNENTWIERPSKRLENSHGHPVSRQIYHLNTKIILQSLALTRLFVTANFSLYNPHTSPIIICVIRENDYLYRDLCTIVSSLYSVCPDLQSLCIMPAEQTSTDLWTACKRAVPIFATVDLDEEAADEVQTFLEEVTSTPDSIVLFNASGKSIWSSEDLPLQPQTAWDGATTLRMHLSQALQNCLPCQREGEAMDMGIA